MRTDELDYELPPELIAQTPADRRDRARLLVVRLNAPVTERIEHRTVADLPALLSPGDLMVFNDTKVLPARFTAIRAATGGKVQGLFLETRDDRTWHVLLQSGGKLRRGDRLLLGRTPRERTPQAASLNEEDAARAVNEDAALELAEQQPDGSWLAKKQTELDTEALLERIGAMPLPPYIEKARQQSHAAIPGEFDRQRYQTVYARSSGAVAAPTAGLHFTPELLGGLDRAGVERAALTLHVGMGTFAPVRAGSLEEHRMHTERFTVPAATLGALAAARREGRRIIPVGTTSVRALESLPPDDEMAAIAARGEGYAGATSILIQPGFSLRFAGGLMTNFHLPRSTLLALVAAITGLEELKRIYRVAIEQRYRFYSYGDAMLVLR